VKTTQYIDALNQIGKSWPHCRGSI